MTHLPWVPSACPLPCTRSPRRSVSCSSHMSRKQLCKNHISQFMIQNIVLLLEQTFVKTHYLCAFGLTEKPKSLFWSMTKKLTATKKRHCRSIRVISTFIDLSFTRPAAQQTFCVVYAKLAAKLVYVFGYILIEF